MIHGVYGDDHVEDGDDAYGDDVSNDVSNGVDDDGEL